MRLLVNYFSLLCTIILFTGGLTTSCEVEDITPESLQVAEWDCPNAPADQDAATTALVGSWRYVARTCPFVAPGEFNYSINTVETYEFKNNGSVIYSRDGEEKDTGTWEFTSETSTNVTVSLTETGEAFSGFVASCDQGMVLDGTPYDGCKAFFIP